MITNASRLGFRRVSIFSPLRKSLREPFEPQAEEHAGTSRLWKNVFFYVCVPSISIGGINLMLNEEPERPEFLPYQHLRIRTKPFPWGDGNRSLFHNPHANALPDGYET